VLNLRPESGASDEARESTEFIRVGDAVSGELAIVLVCEIVRVTSIGSISTGDSC